jgi:26S proteasome regulatory subunit N3
MSAVYSRVLGDSSGQWVPLDVSGVTPEGPVEGAVAAASPTEAQLAATPEVRAFVQLLALIRLNDGGEKDRAVACAADLVAHVRAHARHTMDSLTERVWFYHSRAFELAGRHAEVRGEQIAAYRTACLRHDAATQATLLNIVTRSYLASGLYDQADKLLAKAVFPAEASHNQMSRNLYYLARIRALQLDYAEAHRCVQQALRKAPQQGARGFRLAATKLSVLVQLLLGEVPDRQTFSQPLDLVEPLKPYFDLTKSVRDGDLGHFQATVGQHASVFEADGLTSLVVRLRASVIKTGLRKVSLAYSRISLQDIARKLNIASVEDAESIVAKAIRDGVLDANIDHVKGVVITKGSEDVYRSTEPQEAFHARVQFSLAIRADVIKAMRFPDKVKSETAEEAEERRKRIAEDEELAQALADEEFDD